jgi:hypothetical protein
MALLPTGIIVAPTGNGVGPSERIGGTLLGITSATNTALGNPITKILTLRNTAMDGTAVRSSVVAQLSGINHTYSAAKAYTAGTFAYKQDQFIMRGYTTRINGVANTALLINGNESSRARRYTSNKSKGAKTSTAWRSGYFTFLGISKQRSNWTTPPATNNVTYANGVGGSASDQSLYVTYKAVPGELVYMYGALNPKMDDYKPDNG